MHSEDSQTGLSVRHGQFHQHLETARAQERRVHDVQPVGGPQHDHPFELLDAIHLRQELADHTLGDLATPPAAPGGQGVQLIEEDDTGGRLTGLVKHLAHPTLTFANPLRYELRPFDGDEVDLTLLGHCLGQQRLARPWWAVEQDTLGGRGMHMGEEAAMLKWPLHRLPQQPLDLLQPPDVLPPHLRHLGEDLPNGRGFHLGQGGQEVR